MDHLLNILRTDRCVSNYLKALHALETSVVFKWYVLYEVWGQLTHIVIIWNSSDTEILGYALDTLYNIVCNDEEEEQGRLQFS